MVRFIDVSEVIDMWRDTVTTLSSTIDPPKEFISSEDLALLMLIHYQWDKEKAKSDWLKSRDDVCAALGVSLVESTTSACEVCSREKVKANPACGHACIKHLQSHLKVEVEAGKVKLRCASHNHCHINHVRGMLKAEDIEKFEENILKSFLYSKERTCPCPNNRCGKVVLLEDGEDTSHVIACGSCGTLFCFKCRFFHFPAFCDDAQNWNASVLEGEKLCPKCRGGTLKGEGCLHMTCKYAGCGHEYCWNCLQPWSFNHNLYNCKNREKIGSNPDRLECQDKLRKLERLADKVRAAKKEVDNNFALFDVLTPKCYDDATDQMLRMIDVQRWMNIHKFFNPVMKIFIEDELIIMEKCCMLFENFPLSEEKVAFHAAEAKNRVDSLPRRLVEFIDERIRKRKSSSIIGEHAQHNDAILLVVVPASQPSEISSSRALKAAKEYDPEGTRTVGIISKIDQAAENPKSLAAVQALLSNQGPPKTTDIPWVALIGQSVSIASAR